MGGFVWTGKSRETGLRGHIIRPAVTSKLEIDNRGGLVLRFHDFDLSRPGAKWEEDKSYKATYIKDEALIGYYKLEAVDTMGQNRFRSWLVTSLVDSTSINIYKSNS